MSVSNWPMVSLGNCANIERNGISPDQILSGTKYLGLEHIKIGGEILDQKVVTAGELASSKFSFNNRHLLFGKLRPNLAKIALPNFEGICSTDILPVLPGPHLNRRYLAYFLRQPINVEKVTNLATGANLPRLSPKSLSEFEIPLPPLDEQKRIAAILDKADALRRLRSQALDRLNTLGQSIFHEMFGATPTEYAPFKKSIEEFRYGTSEKSGSHGYPALRIPNIIGGDIDTNEIKLVQVNDKERDRLILKNGDLLFVRTNGNSDYVGRSAVFDDKLRLHGQTDQTWIYASYLIRARLKKSVIPEFAQSFFETPLGRKAIKENSKTSAGQYNINTQGIGSLPFPIVDLEQQKIFAQNLASIKFRKINLSESLMSLDKLFSSLQQRAFRGEL